MTRVSIRLICAALAVAGCLASATDLRGEHHHRRRANDVGGCGGYDYGGMIYGGFGNGGGNATDPSAVPANGGFSDGQTSCRTSDANGSALTSLAPAPLGTAAEDASDFAPDGTASAADEAADCAKLKGEVLLRPAYVFNSDTDRISGTLDADLTAAPPVAPGTRLTKLTKHPRREALESP